LAKDLSQGQRQLKQCDEDIYLIIHTLLNVLLTLPVTVYAHAIASIESFSSLRSLKTWLRNNTDEESLNGLALLHTHQDILTFLAQFKSFSSVFLRTA